MAVWRTLIEQWNGLMENRRCPMFGWFNEARRDAAGGCRLLWG